MGLFKKKSDPISERAQALNEQIAALEDEIKRLSSQPAHEEFSGTAASRDVGEKTPGQGTRPTGNKFSEGSLPTVNKFGQGSGPPEKTATRKNANMEKGAAAASPFAAPVIPSAPVPPQPKLRSTTVPFGQAQTQAGASSVRHEPVFEEVHQSSIKGEAEPAVPEEAPEIGVRKYGTRAV